MLLTYSEQRLTRSIKYSASSRVSSESRSAPCAAKHTHRHRSSPLVGLSVYLDFKGMGPTRPTDEKRSSASRAQSSWASVGDEAAVRSRHSGSWGMSRVTAPCGPGWRPGSLHAAALEARAAGGELARCLLSQCAIYYETQRCDS